MGHGRCSPAGAPRECVTSHRRSAGYRLCCGCGRDSTGMLMTAYAKRDPRTAGQLARPNVPVCCGVPITYRRVFGTLCHCDVVPRDPAPFDLALLGAVAGALARGHHVPPCPSPRRPHSARQHAFQFALVHARTPLDVARARFVVQLAVSAAAGAIVRAQPAAP